MPWSVAPLLVHDEQVPAGARDALRAALEAPPELRSPLLESAARILGRETSVGCWDVMELVGLPLDCTERG